MKLSVAPTALLRTMCGAAALAATTAAQAVVIGGVNFPQGALSFADALVSFEPVVKNNEPGPIFLVGQNAVGAPNYTGTSCTATQCGYVSLGDGGRITLRFIDNRLTGSGTTAPDLWIFEVGPDVEATFVEISRDGSTWLPVGKVQGSTRGVNIDAFGYGPNDRFAYVRLTDDTNLGGQTGVTVGADIDAVGAISTVAAPIPEPAGWLLMGLGLSALALRRRAPRPADAA